jgi:hypothetical protein
VTFDQTGDELAVVVVARAVRARRQSPEAFEHAFAAATVYCQRSGRPGVMVTMVPGRGRWVAVFSSLERLGRFAGECDWQAMTGVDLIAQLPSGMGVLLDVDDEHAMAVPPRTNAADGAQ